VRITKIIALVHKSTMLLSPVQVTSKMFETAECEEVHVSVVSQSVLCVTGCGS